MTAKTFGQRPTRKFDGQQMRREEIAANELRLIKRGAGAIVAMILGTILFNAATAPTRDKVAEVSAINSQVRIFCAQYTGSAGQKCRAAGYKLAVDSIR